MALSHSCSSKRYRSESIYTSIMLWVIRRIFERSVLWKEDFFKGCYVQLNGTHLSDCFATHWNNSTESSMDVQSKYKIFPYLWWNRHTAFNVVYLDFKSSPLLKIKDPLLPTVSPYYGTNNNNVFSIVDYFMLLYFHLFLYSG